MRYNGQVVEIAVLRIFFAPLQGYTDAVYRRAHWRHIGGVDGYYTPFVRMEHGAMRRKDCRDVMPEACEGVPTIPQVIAGSRDELAYLCDELCGMGWRRIDVNMGCPFPMQANAGRGSGLFLHLSEVESICREMSCRSDVQFSVKMRLGYDNVEQGLKVIDMLNDVPLLYIALHARLGMQHYKGSVDADAFERCMQRSKHRMVYNGDITCSEDIALLQNRFPQLYGVMLGRALLANPTMLMHADIECRREAERLLHDEVFQYACRHLCGDHQILSRMRDFWYYSSEMHDDIFHKAYKKVKKAVSLQQYREAAAGEMLRCRL